jgi:hypothetical protein
VTMPSTLSIIFFVVLMIVISVRFGIEIALASPKHAKSVLPILAAISVMLFIGMMLA